MADHAAFLTAIRAEPDDDVHRLVYADWLEDNGQPERGEFIRVQCELARGTASRERQRELIGREQTLRCKHEAEWLAPMRERGLVERVEFERGLATVRVASERLLDPDYEGDAVEAVRRAGVIGLEFAWPEGRPSEVLARSAMLSEFAFLRVNQRPFNKGLAASLAVSPHLSGLKGLGVGYENIEQGSLQVLASSPYLQNLTRLDAGGPWGPFDRLDLEAVTTPGVFPRLRSLTLHGTNFNATFLPHLLGASYFPQLTALDLTSWRLGNDGARAFATAAPTRMQRLGLGYTNITAAGARALAAADLPELTTLDMSACPITPVGANALLSSQHLPRLREFRLWLANPDDSGIRKLVRAKGLRRLTSLQLKDTSLGVAGVRALADSPHLTNLTHLSINLWRGREKAFKQLAQSPSLAGLVSLELHRDKLTVPSAQALANSPYLGDLAVLDLRSCTITPAAARELARGRSLGGLHRIRLPCQNSDGLTPEGEQWLRGRFGDAVQREPR
jgi:uncharacterized protein (TIGR02996 family)